MPQTKCFARLEQSVPTKPPVLTTGDVMAQVAHNFEVTCLKYFMHKDIKADSQVKMIVFGLEDTHLRNWYLG